MKKLLLLLMVALLAVGCRQPENKGNDDDTDTDVEQPGPNPEDPDKYIYFKFTPDNITVKHGVNDYSSSGIAVSVSWVTTDKHPAGAGLTGTSVLLGGSVTSSPELDQLKIDGVLMMTVMNQLPSNQIGLYTKEDTSGGGTGTFWMEGNGKIRTSNVVTVTVID